MKILELSFDIKDIEAFGRLLKVYVEFCLNRVHLLCLLERNCTLSSLDSTIIDSNGPLTSTIEMGSWFSSDAGSSFEASDIDVSIENMDPVNDRANTETGPKRLGVDIVVLEHLSMKYRLAGSDEVLLKSKIKIILSDIDPLLNDG